MNKVRINKLICTISLGLALCGFSELPASNYNYGYNYPQKNSLLEEVLYPSIKYIATIGISALVTFVTIHIAQKFFFKRESNDSYAFFKPKHTLRDYVGGHPQELDTFLSFIQDPATRRGLAPLGIGAPKGCILYGKPGVGKTFLAECIAGTLNIPCISVKAPNLAAPYWGQAEGNVRNLFASARWAAANNASKSCMVIIDEADSVFSAREKDDTRGGFKKDLVNTFLAEINGLDESESKHKVSVIVVACTNAKMENLDSALRRSGRLDRQIEIPPLTAGGVAENLKFYLKKVKVIDDSLSPNISSALNKLADQLHAIYCECSEEGCVTPADIQSLVEGAYSELVISQTRHRGTQPQSQTSLTLAAVLKSISEKVCTKFHKRLESLLQDHGSFRAQFGEINDSLE